MEWLASFNFDEIFWNESELTWVLKIKPKKKAKVRLEEISAMISRSIWRQSAWQEWKGSPLATANDINEFVEFDGFDTIPSAR